MSDHLTIAMALRKRGKDSVPVAEVGLREPIEYNDEGLDVFHEDEFDVRVHRSPAGQLYATIQAPHGDLVRVPNADVLYCVLGETP